MNWHRWPIVLAAVSGLVVCDVSRAADTQRIGLPAGYYQIPARGRLRIAGYCMDQNAAAPEVGVAVTPLGDDEGHSVTLEGTSPVRLSKAVAEKMLDFKTHERSLNEYIDFTEHAYDNLSLPDGMIMCKEKFDPPGADSDTGRMRAMFDDSPLSEALEGIRQFRIKAGESPKSATSELTLSNETVEQYADYLFDKDAPISIPTLTIEKGEFVPRQISLGATVTNHTDVPMLLELRTPLILSTDKKRGLENIDLSKIIAAPGYIERINAQQRVWESNETLAAAHSRNYGHYLTRFVKNSPYRGHTVRGLVHDDDTALVYVDTGKILEVRRVKNDVQETILSGPEAEAAFKKLPREAHGYRIDPPPPKPKLKRGQLPPPP
jgi:hypothetical protein